MLPGIRHPSGPSRRGARSLALAACLAAFIGASRADAAGGPFIWDQDENRIDDRVEQVHLLGYSLSFVDADTSRQQRIEVLPGSELLYGVYVRYDHVPTTTDVASLTLLGMPVLHRIEALPALRSLATFVQVQAASALSGVDRVEAVPLLYGGARSGAAAIAVRDDTEGVFPNWVIAGGGRGNGQVIAILDTGVNDEPAGSWPGHAGLIGRGIGGAQILSPDSTFNTPRNGSFNPSDLGPGTDAHGTHVAAIALGDGAPSGYAEGVASEAYLVDIRVLDETGTGRAIPEALDWCIANRQRNWGHPDPDAIGIDVINLSLSSPDASDGQDLASELATRAAELGIVVVASMGNDDLSSHVPSPAAGDGVIAVGAWDTQRTGETGDDLFVAFSNRGPRASDGDGDSRDEQKPDLVAPGVAILSADGREGGDGAGYRRLSGTSMAAPFVSGIAALLRERYPTITPGELAAVLRRAAWRDLPGIPAAGGGVDPAWRSNVGFGLLDAYEALLELDAPSMTQVRRMAFASVADSLHAVLWTGREQAVAHLVLERAPDTAGVPGGFAPFDSVVASGDSSLTSEGFARYAFSWVVPPAELGQSFWWRAAWSEGGFRRSTPARRIGGPVGPTAAEIEVTIVHDAYDNDVSAWVEAGGGAVRFDLPATSQAVSSDLVSGTSTIGTIAWTFRVPVPEGAAEAFLPPSPSHPWTLHVEDGGFANRSGRITDYRIVWHGPGGDESYAGSPIPLPTLEGDEVIATAPSPLTDVTPTSGRAVFALWPNPARAGSAVALAPGFAGGATVLVFDLSGRRIARIATQAAGRSTWLTRDDQGRALPAGLYLVSSGGNTARVVLFR
jgi:subtilisin family serine protease